VPIGVEAKEGEEAGSSHTTADESCSSHPRAGSSRKREASQKTCITGGTVMTKNFFASSHPQTLN
jgi:hypothetical protein